MKWEKGEWGWYGRNHCTWRWNGVQQRSGLCVEMRREMCMNRRERDEIRGNRQSSWIWCGGCILIELECMMGASFTDNSVMQKEWLFDSMCPTALAGCTIEPTHHPINGKGISCSDLMECNWMDDYPIEVPSRRDTIDSILTTIGEWHWKVKWQGIGWLWRNRMKPYDCVSDELEHVLRPPFDREHKSVRDNLVFQF